MIIKHLIYLTIFSAPLYLVRFPVFGIPTNILDILMFITIFFTIIDSLKKRKLPIDISSLKTSNNTSAYTLFILLVVSGLIISTVTNGNNHHSWGIIKSWFILPLIFSLIVSQYFKTTDCKLNILKTIFYSSTTVAIISLFYYFFNNLTYDDRLRAFYLSPNHLAMYLSLGLVIGTWIINWQFLLNFSFNKKNNSFLKNYYYLIGCCFLFIGILLSYSQGAWLAIIFSFALIKSIQRYSNNKFNIYHLLLIFFCLLLIACYLLFITTTPNSSFSSRLMIWQSAILILKDNWFLGIGAGNFQIKYLEYQKHFSPYLEWAVPQPHNLYLAFWLQSGLIGLLGFLGLIFIYCQKLFHKIKIIINGNEKKIALILLTLIFTLLIHGVVDTPIWKNDLALVFWIIVFLA